MAQKNNDQKKNSPGTKGKIEKSPQGASEESKIVNVVADKVLVESKKPQKKPSIFTTLNDKLLSKIKLPAPLAKHLGQFGQMSYHFNTSTEHGRANISKATYAAIALTFIYFKFIRKKSSDKQKTTASTSAKS